MRILTALIPLSLASLAPATLSECEEPTPTATLEIGEITTADEDGDGAWEAAEVLNVTVELVNASSVDFNYYPGVRLTTDSPYATVESEEFWYYAIFAGTSYEAPFTVRAHRDAPAGTVVTFTAEATALSCPADPCPEGEVATFTATIRRSPTPARPASPR